MEGQRCTGQAGCGSFLRVQQGTLSRIAGDALPLGILEEIGEDEQSGSSFRLDAGDAVILLTDGVEDAFRTRQALEDAVLTALASDSPEGAAKALLEAALAADDGERRDDQSAVFAYISRGMRARDALH